MFIPFYVNDYNEFKNEVLKSGQFTEEDTRDFVQPFLNNQFAPVQGILEYTKMQPEIYLCYSMSKNGRGFDTKGVAVLSPAGKEQYAYSYFFILHELTHSITDPIMGETISSTDKNHDTVEKMVFLFDYYLLERKAPEQLWEYLDFIKIDKQQINADELEEIYQKPDAYLQKIHKIINEI